MSPMRKGHYAEARQTAAPIYPRVTIPQTEVRLLHSSTVGDDFEISVALPQDYASSDRTYPVLYLTDANMWFAATVQILRFLQLPAPDALPPLLCVGVGYPTESVGTWRDLRRRDLTPTPLRDPSDRLSGGAAPFLGFITEELLPYVEENYRTSRQTAYCGGSYGGLFGLYALFHRPESFQRYLLISPSIGYDERVALQYEADYARQHSDLRAKVFMSVGGLEQLGGSLDGMITDMRHLADKLQSRHYPNLHLETVVFEGETHRSGIAAAISRGLRSIYLA